MIRLLGMLSGILLTTGLYFLYLNFNMQPAPVSADIGTQQTIEEQGSSPAQATLPEKQAHDAGTETRVTEPNLNGQQPSSALAESDPVSGSIIHTATFWKPFRSQYSASGFARRISNATGIQTQVRPADKHQYQVVFDYLDEHDRAAKISLIESTTGLKLDAAPTP